METNNRKLVLDFHKAFELLISNEPYNNIFYEKPEVVHLRYSLIHEEFNELLQAIEQCDIEQVIDALMDMLYVIYGAQISYGVSSSLASFENYICAIQDFKLKKLGKKINKESLNKSLDEFKNGLERLKGATSIDEVKGLLNEMLVGTYYMCLVQNFDVDYCFMLVHKSNMSKLCQTEELAQKTVEWYREHHLATYDSPAYKYNKDLNLWIVYNKSTGKVLKSIRYHPVSFKEYLEHHP